MVRVEIVPYERFPELLALRIEVFVDEQGVPAQEEADGLDPDCTHFLASGEGGSLGTARLRMLPDGAGKAERVAVRARARGHGAGRALMDALEDEARRRGASEVRLNAQVEALPFYEALGYVAHGARFEEAGIPHRAMRKVFSGRD